MPLCSVCQIISILLSLSDIVSDFWIDYVSDMGRPTPESVFCILLNGSELIFELSQLVDFFWKMSILKLLCSVYIYIYIGSRIFFVFLGLLFEGKLLPFCDLLAWPRTL